MVNTGLAIEGSNTYPHSVACPRIYQPICTMEGRTLSNECSFCNYMIATHLLRKSMLLWLHTTPLIIYLEVNLV